MSAQSASNTCNKGLLSAIRVSCFVIAVTMLAVEGKPNNMARNQARLRSESRRDVSRYKTFSADISVERRDVDFYQPFRNRRISGLVPIRSRTQNALCTYEVVTDVNYQRIPSKIERMICKTEDCKVVDDNDYSCVQLYAQLNVTYPKENCRMEYEVMNIEYACICAKSIGSTRITIIEPVFT